MGNCNNGRHEIHSTKPFGLTVWGWGSGETGNVGAGFYSAIRELRLSRRSEREAHQQRRGVTRRSLIAEIC